MQLTHWTVLSTIDTLAIQIIRFEQSKGEAQGLFKSNNLNSLGVYLVRKRSFVLCSGGDVEGRGQAPALSPKIFFSN